jgi:hypothetical protein
MAHYYPIDEHAETSARGCAFYLAQDIGEPQAQAKLLARIVAHYLETGELELAAQALEPLYDVADSHERGQSFAELAGLAAKRGHDDFALQLADAEEDETWQDTARHHIALAQAERRDYEAARETALALGYPEPTLDEIGRHAAEHNEPQALAIADALEEPRRYILLLCDIAARRAADGQTAEALSLLDEAAQALLDVDLPDEQVETLCVLGARYAALGSAEQAARHLSRAQQIAEEEADDNLLLRVAEGWLAVNDIEKALYVAEEIDAFDISWLYANIAHAQARKGDFLAARNLLDTLKDDYHKGRGCLLLARVYEENKDAENFREQLNRAFSLTRDSRVQTLNDATARNALLGAIATEFMVAQDETKAREIAALMPEGQPRDKAWAFIAMKEINDGRFRDAIATANEVSVGERSLAQTALLQEIAGFEARTTQNWSLLRDSLKGVQGFLQRLDAYLKVADYLADEGLAEEAENLYCAAQSDAQTQENPAPAAVGLGLIAARYDGLKAAQLFSAAVKKTAHIKDRYQLTHTLLDLAETQDTLKCRPDAEAQTVMQQHLPI